MVTAPYCVQITYEDPKASFYYRVCFRRMFNDKLFFKFHIMGTLAEIAGGMSLVNVAIPGGFNNLEKPTAKIYISYIYIAIL